MQPFRIAITADLHWGVRHRAGNEATRQLVEHLERDPPDLLILGGDIGAGEQFGECLDLFRNLNCLKAAVPGNHDVWVNSNDARGDSRQVYREHLPAECERRGFDYLDQGPLVLPELDLAIVGTMNWYDYSWSIDDLPKFADDWEDRLKRKRFSRGQHNDANFVRWETNDVDFTRELARTLQAHLEAVGTANIIAVTHHPCFYELNYPKPGPPTLDGRLWDAFSGNVAVEELLKTDPRIRFAFCGHTHFAREATVGTVRGYNVGGDYHFKRLLSLEWPSGAVNAVEFFGS